jgi:Acetyltransferase (GNAT) domain
VQQLTLAELDEAADELDAAALASSDIDSFCSSSMWVIPAARGLMPIEEPFIRRSEAGFVVLGRRGQDGLPTLQPLEAMWGLACPVVGPDPDALAVEIAEALDGERALILFCGLGRRSSRFEALTRVLGKKWGMRLGPTTRRWVAELDGGVDGFLSRRSRNFREAALKARRRAREAGLELVRWDGVGDPFARILAADRKTWKARAETGLAAEPMRDFYADMVPRLRRRDALRLGFARLGGEDVGYCLGAVFGGTYRGLQFGFAAGLERFSIGNLLQLAEIEALTSEGAASRYDLGSDADYKARWADSAQESVTLLAWPRE